MATDSYVQVPPDSGGKKIDTEEVQTSAATLVERQRVSIPDAVEVESDTLIKMLAEQRVANFILAEGLNVNDDLEDLRQEYYDLTTPGAVQLDVEDQSLSGGANVVAKSLNTGNITVDCGARPLQYITNGGAFTITAPAYDGSCMLMVTNNATAGSITFSGFTVGASTGDTLDTTSGHIFTISIWRINSVSGYRIAAHQ